MTSELLDEIHCLPANIERVERVLKIEQGKYELLLGMQPLTERIAKLTVDTPKMKQNLKQTEEKLSAALAEADAFVMSLAEPNANMELANSMLGDMTLLDEANKDVERIQKELAALRAKMPESTTTMTMDEAQQKRTTLSTSLRKERQHCDHLQSQYDEHSKMLNTLRDKRNKLKDQQIALQEGAQALPSLKQRQIEIAQMIEKIVGEMAKLERDLGPMKEQLQQAITAKQRAVNANREKLGAATLNLNNMKRTNSEVNK